MSNNQFNSFQALQNQLPAAIRYVRPEEVVQLQAAFEHLLATGAQQVKTKNHLHAHQVQRDVNIPMFTVLAKWLQLQTASLLQWAQMALCDLAEPEPIVGIPEDESDALLAGLEELHELCSAHMPQEFCPRALDVLKDMRELVESLTLEADAEGEDFEEADDDDEGILADDDEDEDLADDDTEEANSSAMF